MWHVLRELRFAFSSLLVRLVHLVPLVRVDSSSVGKSMYILFSGDMFITCFAGRLYRNLTELCTTSSAYCGGLRMKNSTLHVARSKLLERTFNL